MANTETNHDMEQSILKVAEKLFLTVLQQLKSHEL